MPLTRGTCGQRGDATTRGHPDAKPKQALPKTPSQWPHLTKGKQDQQPLEAQPGCAFLSLQISTFGSHIRHKGWEVLSQRASVYSPQKAAEQKSQAAKIRQERAGRRALQKKQKLEQENLASERVGFVALKLSTGALERSQLPFAQTWRSSRAVNIKPIDDREIQTSDLKPSIWESRTSPFLSPSVPKELEFAQRPVTRNLPVLNTILVKNPGLTDQRTPERPEFSPITPTAPVAQEYLLSSATGPLTRIQNDTLHQDFDYCYPENPYMMSGKSSVDTGGVDESIKDVIQNLFVMQQHVASYRPEIQDGLQRKVEDVASSVQKLHELVASPSNPIHDIKIAPDIIDYVDDGRNPDIYTRDFVELVQRGNAVLNGKQRAFRNFSKIFAKSLKDNFEGMDEEVDSIMETAGMEEKDGKFIEKQQNGKAT